MKLKSIIKTCESCPSQWDAVLADGRPLYIRYRWGYLDVAIYDTNNHNWGEYRTAERLFSDQIGDEYDGTLSLGDMLRMTGLIVTEETAIIGDGV